MTALQKAIARADAAEAELKKLRGAAAEDDQENTDENAEGEDQENQDETAEGEDDTEENAEGEDEEETDETAEGEDDEDSDEVAEGEEDEDEEPKALTPSVRKAIAKSVAAAVGIARKSLDAEFAKKEAGFDARVSKAAAQLLASQAGTPLKIGGKPKNAAANGTPASRLEATIAAELAGNKTN